MFTLGNKEAIINSPSKFPVTTTAPAGTNSLLTIKGFGAFEDTHIVSAIAQRFIASRVAEITITAPDAAALGILAAEVNVPVVVHIRVNTTRHTSEWATDFIKRGRPFIFEILVDGGDTATTIMTKLVTLFTEYEARFNSDKGLPYTWSQSGDDVTLTLKDGYLSFQNFVDFLPRGLTYGIKAVTTKVIALTTIGTGSTGADTTQDVVSTAGILVGDTITIDATAVVVVEVTDATTLEITPSYDSTDADVVYLHSEPQEPTWDGKYLEENVRFSNAVTGDSYAISPDETATIVGSYTEITFTAKSNGTGGIDNLHKPHAFLGTTRGEIGGERKFTFTLYLLEGTTMFDTDAKVDDILAFLFTALVTTPAIAATGSVELTGGGSGSVDGITVNSVEIMSGAEAFDTNLDDTATAVAANITAHTSVPNYTAEATGSVVTITADATGVGPNGFAVVSSTTTITTTDVNMSGGAITVSAATMNIANGNTVTTVADFLANTY